MDNYRSALAHLYMAFEMRAALTCRHVGTSKVGADGVEAFLEPKEKDEGRPTIFKIIKQTRDWSATGPSKTQLDRELGQLWKHRNAVMHGKHIDIQASDVGEALVPFHSLVAWLVSAQPKLD